MTTCRASEASPNLVLNITIYMYIHTSHYLLFERNIVHELNKCILYSYIYTVQLRHDTETPEVRATQMGTREVTQAHLQQLTWLFFILLVLGQAGVLVITLLLLLCCALRSFG